jgi:hypothetical protein
MSPVDPNTVCAHPLRHLPEARNKIQALPSFIKIRGKHLAAPLRLQALDPGRNDHEPSCELRRSCAVMRTDP